MNHVVACVAKRLAGNRERILQGIPALDFCKAQRIAEHFRQIVLHQQRFVLVDREADVTLRRIDHDVDAAMAQAALPQEMIDILEQTEARIRKVDRIDWMLRNGNAQANSRDHAFVVVGKDRGGTLAPHRRRHPIEFNKVHRRVGPSAVGDAIAQSCADVSQVRVGIAWLHFLLFVAQFGAQLHPVVAILAALRKQGMERAKELGEKVLAVMQANGEALIEVPRSGMEGAIEGSLVAAQDVAGFFLNP
jgi:hypothetical protein